MNSSETDLNDLPEDASASNDQGSDEWDVDDEGGDDGPDAEGKPPLTLEVSVQSPSACQRHVTVTVSKADVERYFDTELKDLAPKAAVPGFRPGRAPRKLVESHFRDQVADKVKGALLMDTLDQVSREHEFSPISEPDLNFGAIELPQDGPFKFEFDLEVRPQFDLPDWKNLKIDQPTREFSDEDVDRHLRRLLERHAELIKKDGPATPGDRLTVDITFRHAGEVISELEAVTVKLLPTLSFRDGELTHFDQLMSGASEGDRRDAKVTINANSESEALRGQEVDAEVEVLEVHAVQVPKLTPQFLDSIGGFTDELELREAVREELNRQFGASKQRKIREQITSQLTAGANWQLPPELLKRQAKRELHRAVMELQAAGVSDEEIRQHANWIQQNSTVSTAKALKEHFILERIAEDQEIDAAPVDFDDEIRLLADQSGESPRRIRARLEKRGEMDTLRNQIVERKVIELICRHATIQEVRSDDFGVVPQVTAIDHTIGGQEESAIPEAKHGGDAQPLHQPAERP